MLATLRNRIYILSFNKPHKAIRWLINKYPLKIIETLPYLSSPANPDPEYYLVRISNKNVPLKTGFSSTQGLVKKNQQSHESSFVNRLNSDSSKSIATAILPPLLILFMTFIAFIEKYYSSNQQHEIALVLNDFGIYSDIEDSINEFYKTAGSSNKMEIISQLVLTTREIVTTIYTSLRGIHSNEQKDSERQKITELAIYLVKDCYRLSRLGFIEYFDLLIQTARKTYAKHSWDFTDLEKLLSFDNIKTLANDRNESNNNRNGLPRSKPVKLYWQGKKQLDLFVDDLTKTFHGVRSKKQVYLLFDWIKTDFKIELSSKYLLPFLSLFHELHESGAIKVIGNRGLFVYLTQHLQAPPMDNYPKRDFRKLRHEAWQNEKMKKDISRIIQPLLDKYCHSGR